MGEARMPVVHATQTHVSAGRRLRLRVRRTLALLAAVVVLTSGYAVARGGDATVKPGAGSGSPTGRAEPSASTTTPPTRTASTTAPVAIVSPWIAPTKIGLDDPVPGTTNLQPPMVRAYDRAAAAAAKAGHPMTIRSGWRSAAYQQILFDRAVAKYGSRVEAAKWVLPPEDSAHVQGLAVDVQPLGAAQWLQAHGTAYGLCRTYANEWWHFELVAIGPVDACPAMKPSAAG